MAKKRQLSKEEQKLWERFTVPVRVLKRDKYRPVDPIAKMVIKDEELFYSMMKENENSHHQYLLNKLQENSSFIQHYKSFKSRQNAHIPKERFHSIGDKQAGLDKATWKRLQKGEIRPEWTLDLHGYIAQQALIMLENFLVKAYQGHIRCVDVITGIGSGYKEGGILKRELPHWLNRPYIKTLILATLYTSPQNGGAVRILLKRNR